MRTKKEGGRGHALGWIQREEELVWRSKARQKRSLMMLLSCSCCGILLNAARRGGGEMLGWRKRERGKEGGREDRMFLEQFVPMSVSCE